MLKFRRERLKDNNLLDILIGKIWINIREKEIIKNKIVIGDGVYFKKLNNIKLVSKLNKRVIWGKERKSGNFNFNKNTSIYVCKEGYSLKNYKIYKKARK